MTINECMVLLVEELREGEIPLPLAQSFTLATVWADLARLAGEVPPVAVQAIVGDTLDQVIEPLPRRGHGAVAWLPAD